MTCCSKWLRLALWSVVAAVAAVASPTTAGAAEKGTLTIKDGGNVFTAEGVRKAEEAFESVTFQAPTKLAVVTFGKVPEAKRSAFEEAKSPDAKKRFFREWAEEVARSSGKPDVLVFISMEGSHIRALDDRQADLKRHFDDKDLHALEQKFVAGFKPGEAATKVARHDAALLDGVKYVAEQLKDTTVAANKNGRHAAQDSNAGETKGTSLWTYVCIGIVALLGIWLVIGVVRMMMGGGGGGGGYGGGGMMGGGGGMMGGGGGGLMTGLLGGMLGAVAGNYLYNNFMGGSSHASDPAGSGGDAGTTGDTGAGDYSGGGDGGGSDFGGDTTSGDTGGGDFGGGDSGGGDLGGGDCGGACDFGGGDSGGGDFGGGSDFGGGDSGGGDW